MNGWCQIIFNDSTLDQGKIRSIGVSNFEVTHIDELWDIVKHRPVLNQCLFIVIIFKTIIVIWYSGEFHPYLTRKTLRNYCRSKGIFFQVMFLFVIIIKYFYIFRYYASVDFRPIHRSLKTQGHYITNRQ